MRWPQSCPVFLFRHYAGELVQPTCYVIGSGFVADSSVEALARLFPIEAYDEEGKIGWAGFDELTPLTWAAREMLAIARGIDTEKEED